MRATSLGSLLSVVLAGTVCGQDVTLQQPIVGVTSVSTSVAVPDRGRVFLGGVSSTQSSRSRFGYGPPGSSIGLSRSSNSLSAGVTIIDLREMDEAILNSVPDRPQPSSPFSRHAAAINASRAGRPRERRHTEVESPTDRAAKYERLARKAEAENHPGVAKLHWQMAAKYGSAAARERSHQGDVAGPNSSKQSR